jgi:hypothetical protein
MEFFNDIGGDPHKPSLFELVAQEQLRDLLQPALKYVLAVCVEIAVDFLLPLTPGPGTHTGFRAAISKIPSSGRKPP